MNRKQDGKQISWKTVKYLAQLLSGAVIMVAVLVSVRTLPSEQIAHETTEDKMVSVHNRVENQGSSAILSMQSSEVVSTQRDERERLVSAEKSSTEQNAEDGKDVADEKASLADVVETKNSKSSARGKNRVVPLNIEDKNGKKLGNRVVENPKPDKLVSRLFENYGEKPEVPEAVVSVFQYPVELGYATDSNYDGNLLKKNTILNFTADTDEDTTTERPEEETSEATTEDFDEREQFKKEIWSKILTTEPVDVKIVAEEKTTEKNETTQEQEMMPEDDATSDEEVDTDDASETLDEEDSKATSDITEDVTTEEVAQEETTQSAQEEREEEDATDAEEQIVADDTFFIIKGKMRVDHSVFVGDIEIKASGKDGFDRVRIGESGEFAESVIITEDAMNQTLTLYFTDGESVTTGVLWTYSKDTANPQFALKEESYQVLQSDISKIYCTKDLSLDIDMSKEDKDTTRVHYIYGDKLVYITDLKEDVKPTLQKEFFGRVMMCGEDIAGNVSEPLSEYFLVEQNAPTVSFSQDEFCTLPYSLWVQIEDEGHIISGIRDVVCIVNGEEREIANAEILEKVVLDEGLEVPSSMLFPIVYEEEGKYEVQITVTDNAGNVTTQERKLEVTKPELVAVCMPEKFTIHIDPQQLAGREQIFSDAIELKNVSEFDVEVTVDSVNLKVIDEISSEGVVKDCEMYLVAPDTGEKILLSKGENDEVYSYRLPAGAEGDIANLTFVGITTDGSEHMWKGSDISLEVKLSFKKWE